MVLTKKRQLLVSTVSRVAEELEKVQKVQSPQKILITIK
jgi:hypothetical protein